MKFYIDQHGCAKNQVDGEEIIARLEAAGHSCVERGADADLVIVNTCGFIESAKRESIEAVMGIKAAWPGKKILVAGCLAQRYPDELLGDLVEADGVFGNADLSLVGEAAQSALDGERRALAPPQPEKIDSSPISRSRLMDFPGTAHVKITEGCDNRCTYCAIPLIRGVLRSREPADIVAEIRDLADRGLKELVLIGQDLGSYGADLGGKINLPDLLGKISRIEGDFRIRVLYIHPDHFPRRILDLMLEEPRIIPYFDLPFQHASGRILSAMKRRGSPEKYLELIGDIRKKLPESMIRSTFLVGFPGETEEDFQILLDFQEKARIDWLGAFAYSREEGTPAHGFRGRVPKRIAEERKRRIEAAQELITAERLERFVGSEVRLLAEERIEGEAMTLCRAWMQAPEVDGLTVLKAEAAPGSFVRARIVAVRGVDFEAELSGTVS